MGGCVLSLMDHRAEGTEVDDPLCEAVRKYGPLTLPLEGTATATSSLIYLNGKRPTAAEQKKLANDYYNGPNQTQRFEKLCRDHLDDVAVSYRKVEKIVKETVEGVSRLMDVSYLSDRRFVKYRELYDAFMSFSRGLAELGLAPRCNVSIYEETRWEWLATIYGIWMQDMVASTVYANLGEDALFYALRETECSAIVCNGKSVPLLLQGVGAGRFPASTIIYLDNLPATGCEATHGCRVIAWTAVAELGRSESGKKRVAEPPKDNDAVALIMYTSGTTGDPKGVVHTHGSIIAGILSMDDWVYSCVEQKEDDVYLSYLPLAHILEFGVVNIFLARGATVGFGSPRTLTDATAKPHGDFIEYRPTLFIGVPRVFDTLKRAVEAKLPKPGSLKRKVFDHAYQTRLEALQRGKDTPYWNEKVFKQARAALGGRVRATLSGGGPLSVSTHEFINVVFCFLACGWGLTETICVGAIQRVGDARTGVVGQVIASEELKLIDTEEYKHTDQPHPRGELCLRGPFLFKGYYKKPELTAEAIDAEGWFHTGDIGSIDNTGRVSVIGRIKALAKNCLGEYIALEALEAIYANHRLVLNNGVCVVVHPEKNYICALVLTDESRVKRFARESRIEGEYPALLKNKELLTKAAESMSEVGKNAKRRHFELLRHVCLVDDEWSPENGVLTAALKLRRSVIEERYAKEIAELFVE
ncbi:putative mitochondrial long-chain-fatty-acid-CoA ligase [Leptomonas pyrrhocoris]|uniref:Putative mitochondrial long-chain-fatty-acid-CoA ligase n=1 Tax=Leptomonas pyrrhocoris TaxID=157538 RepID=A0A0M9FQ07_LEPPY|nr:putative mitochondrial long-chain-fatty-acid-CoA ligase [Leptomonas pyrrhocoris]XP_015652156.1 putative mitochondrial long-chain-fatty-acid-CoA ligase [Leptomonas pyrrhocoris]XP_015652157.1 putative mitochondrial long-chain-fatty-acid-CoA ligase [Leptomonas pyrrhocoris]XP_015652158.1 putative mitochondrial long-chain-fatty-acid-CoA ligase [Leptomonas pyrrhocoris]XP_015652159.1 putative mitochondrial long-chain-fatty-acid-CoA ligase [Leptomonas pyrrhocoris]KPA73716.1 putative mitochondrial l|eukprot:XP_015652155.1 putative mitochondrial long-chain-fatty-acid-CoA ligase [Leptomonas pyrrhocoris]